MFYVVTPMRGNDGNHLQPIQYLGLKIHAVLQRAINPVDPITREVVTEAVLLLRQDNPAVYFPDVQTCVVRGDWISAGYECTNARVTVDNVVRRIAFEGTTSEGMPFHVSAREVFEAASRWINEQSDESDEKRRWGRKLLDEIKSRMAPDGTGPGDAPAWLMVSVPTSAEVDAVFVQVTEELWKFVSDRYPGSETFRLHALMLPFMTQELPREAVNALAEAFPFIFRALPGF